MKRSELNQIIENAIKFMDRHGLKLPPFAYWTPSDLPKLNEEHREIIDHMLGWDITDFGSGDFNRIGLLMFTARNGLFSDIAGTKPYAEKYMVVQENQVTPYHFHWKKTEDIINRGGGNLIIKLYMPAPDGQLSDADVIVNMDGRRFTVPAGTEIGLHPGESICLHHGQYHQFWGEPGTGPVLVGEVSCTNDDHVDNRFLSPTGRFPSIEEDEPARYLLFSELKIG